MKEGNGKKQPQVIGAVYVGKTTDPMWSEAYICLAGKRIGTGLDVRAARYYKGDTKDEIHVFLTGKCRTPKVFRKTVMLGPWPEGREKLVGIEVDVVVRRNGAEIEDTRWA